MKQTIKQIFQMLMVILIIVYHLDVNGQVPQKFNYQGIARDVKGNPLTKQHLSLKITVLPTSDATVSEYEETHEVTTNDFGLYTLQIGNGTPLSGEMKTVKWETGNKYIKVAIDLAGGSNYVDAGTTQLLSVPYAIYADKAGMAKETVTSDHGGTRTGAVNSNAAHVAADANYVSKFTGLNLIGKSQILDNGTNVGINTTAPFAKLQMSSNPYTGTLLPATELRIQHLDTVNNASRLSFFNDNNSGFTATGEYAILNKYAKGKTGNYTAGFPFSRLFTFANSKGSLIFATGGNIGLGYFDRATSITTTRLFIDSTSGNVGLGTITPASRLEVAGQVKITGGAPGAGKVLTSDATGLASWQTPASTGLVGSGTLNFIPKFTPSGTQVGNSQVFDNGSFVGIGTTSPVAKLQISAINDSAMISTSTISQDSATGNYFSTGSTFGVSPLTYGLIAEVTSDDFGAGIFGRGYGSTPLPFTTRDCGIYGSANFSNTAIGILGSSDNGTSLMGLSKTGTAAYLKAPNGLALLADSGNVLVNNGSLGIGVAPFVKLHSKTSGGYSGYFESSDVNNWLGFANIDGYNTYLGNYLNGSSAFDIMTTSPTTELNLGVYYTTRLKIKTDGKIGMGTESPRSQLDISKANQPFVTITEALPIGGDTMGIDFFKPDNTGSGIWTDWRIASIMNGGNFEIQTSGDDFNSTPVTRLAIGPSGGVTINDGLTLNLGGAAEGKVLSSDGSGNASWKSNQSGNMVSGAVISPTSTLAMLTGGVSITITSSTQKVMWNVSAAMGSIAVGGGTGLSLTPAYYNVSTSSTVNTLGGWLLGLSCPQNGRQVYSVNGFITGLAPGTYIFGMGGSSGNAASWNSNDYYYVNAMVFE